MSCRELAWLAARGLTILPDRLRPVSAQGEQIATALSGSAHPNRAQQAVALYTHAAGIEGGYGFFAPNIPDSFALVFEIHLADGTVEYEQPPVSSATAQLHLAGLLDKLGHGESDALREGLIKMMARSIWQRHPGATSIRAVFGSINLPEVGEFAAGKKPSFEPLWAYDFSLKSAAATNDRP